MKRIAIALCLIASSAMSAERLFSTEQELSMAMVADSFMAEDYCPNLRVVNGASKLEVEYYDWGNTPETSIAFNQALDRARTNVTDDPEKYCDEVWQLIGAGGVYRHQMLEKKQ